MQTIKYSNIIFEFLAEIRYTKVNDKLAEFGWYPLL